MRCESAIVERQKQSQFICSACSSARDCDCNAPALELEAARLAAHRAANRKHYEKKKAEQKQRSSDIRSEPAERRGDNSSTNKVVGLDGERYPAKGTGSNANLKESAAERRKATYAVEPEPVWTAIGHRTFGSACWCNGGRCDRDAREL